MGKPDFQSPCIKPAQKRSGASASLDEALAGKRANMFNPETLDLLETVSSLSRYLQDCLFKEVDYVAAAYADGVDAAFEQLTATTHKLAFEFTDESEFMTSLRVAKRRAALLCGLCDLSGQWRNEQVTERLSKFACAALSASFDFILLHSHRSGKLELENPETPQAQSGLIVLGMGKFGANELNYSSDIDIITFHEDAPGMRLVTDDPTTLLNRMMKQLIKLMQERTADGYVFRTDLRLRPDPSSTPLVIPAEAALNYYEGQGQNWERAAMIKATPVCGDEAAGNRFLKELTPFIWRKYLDFAAIQDVHSIKRQIHVHKGHGDIRVAGHNIKLGRGGIREIEFFAQTQQLIAGGRNPALREKETTQALDALAAHAWIAEDTASELKHAYWYLRNLEHRLQMLNDEQTHTIPDDRGDFATIAAMAGSLEPKAFAKEVKAVLRNVERHYANLFEQAPELSSGYGNFVFTGDDHDPYTEKTLEELGFQKPEEIIKIIKQWHVAKLPALQTSAARELLTELVPTLLEAFSQAPDPDAVMYTFDRFLKGLPAGIQLFAILKSNPALNSLLVRILIAAPALAEQISQKPHVFDGMLEKQFVDDIPDRNALEAALLERLHTVSVYEMKLDTARRFFHEVRFQIACRCIGHTLNYRETALALSNLAEAIIGVMLEVVKADFETMHGKVEGSRTCIVAMGRLGSRELTADSDLDLIFLYDFDGNQAQSDGGKPLDPTLYFMRLIKRFITAMTAPTAEGALFQLDFRLRPSGNAGPLATQIDGFLKYQREDAWIWEAQALTRARPVAGDLALCQRIADEVPQLLKLRSKAKDLDAGIYKMRLLIEKEKGTDFIWDMKTGAGGLLDIEFIAQWLVLKHAAGSSSPTGSREILTSHAMHLPLGDGEQLLNAFDTFSEVLHLQRICHGDCDPSAEFPIGFEGVICSALDLPDLQSCEAHIGDMKKTTRKTFEKLLGP